MVFPPFFVIDSKYFAQFEIKHFCRQDTKSQAKAERQGSTFRVEKHPTGVTFEPRTSEP
jgi:hypothetical protein